MPDWADFPPNWATFHHIRLEKLSLGGKSAKSGNAVDNKSTLPVVPFSLRDAKQVKSPVRIR